MRLLILLRSDISFFLLKTVSHVCGLSPVPSSCDSHRSTTSIKQSFATPWQLRDTSSLMCSSTLNWSELNFLYTQVEWKVTLNICTYVHLHVYLSYMCASECMCVYACRYLFA